MNNESPSARQFQIGAMSRTAGPGGSASAAKGVQISDVVLVLRRWWWQSALSGAILAVLAVGGVWMTFEPLYEATAFLTIRMRPPYKAFPAAGDSQAYHETQLEIMRNPIVLNKVINQPEIARLPELREADFPLDWLKKRLKAQYVGRSELCQITFHSRDPHAAALVANSVMDAYLALHLYEVAEQSQEIVELLQEEKTKRTAELELLKERVRALTKESSDQENPALAQILRQSPLAGMEQERASAEVQVALLRADLAANEKQIEEKKFEISTAVLNSALESHPDVEVLRQKLAEARATLKAVAGPLRGKESDDYAKKPAREVRDLEASLEQTLAELRPQILKELEEAELANLTTASKDLQARLDTQLLSLKIWTEQVDQQRKKLATQGEESLELEFAKYDLEWSQQVFKLISDRMQVVQTERDAPPRARVLERAKESPVPLEARPYKKFAMAILGAFALPLGLAFLWERWARRISDAQQLIGEMNVPVLGEIVALPVRSVIPTLGSRQRLLRDRYTFEESIDSLRVGLTLAPELHGVQALVVTSAISQEGKTSLVSSLALSLARGTNESILVIDADTRAPDLHEIFGVALQPGLVEVLEGSHTPDEAIVANAEHGIHVLPAGQLRMSPHQLLRNGMFASLLDKLRGQYRYIIIDTPPVLLASETLVVARAADGALICTMRDFSRSAQLRMARERLVSAGVRLLGAVINGVPTPVWYQKYGSYLYAGRSPETGSGDHGSQQVQA